MFNKNHTPKRTVKNAVLKVPFTMPADLTNDIHNEIMDIIETTKFDKISGFLVIFSKNTFRKKN